MIDSNCPMKPKMLTFFQEMHNAEQQLWLQHGIRDQGAYAARLVAEALGAHVVTNGVNRGFDLEHPTLKRIEVRSRRKPFDQRNELRIELSAKKRGYFDHCAHVAFESDYTVIGAYIIHHDAAYRHLEATGKRYMRFDQGAALSSSVDITAKVIVAQGNL